MHKVRKSKKFASRWLASALLLITATEQAAPEAVATASQPEMITVGFVRHAQGIWLDALHNTTLMTGSAVFENARVVRKDAADNTASIEIYLLEGKTVVRKCANASCASAIEITHKPSLDAEPIERLKRLMKALFAPAETEEGAVTFASVDPVGSQWKKAYIEGVCDSDQPAYFKLPDGVRKCSPPLYAAGTVSRGGHIHWIAEWGGGPPSSILGVKETDPAGEATDPVVTNDRLLDLIQQVLAQHKGPPDSVTGGATEGSEAKQVRTLYKIASEPESPHETTAPPRKSPPSPGTPIRCRLDSGSQLHCTPSEPGPGVYATSGFRGLVFSEERIECLQQALSEIAAAQALFNGWNKVASPEERLENERVSTRYAKDQFSACQDFRPVTPTQTVPNPPDREPPTPQTHLYGAPPR